MSEKRKRMTREEHTGRTGREKRRMRVVWYTVCMLFLLLAGFGTFIFFPTNLFESAAGFRGMDEDTYVSDGHIPLAALEPLESSVPSEERTIAGEEAFKQAVHLSYDMVDGMCNLHWDESACDFYTVQMMEGDAGVWDTVKTVAKGDECIYISQRLRPGTSYAFRVIAEAGEDTVVSEVIECEAPVTPIYCTVWPLKNLEAYSSAEKSEVMGEAAALDAYYVIDVKDGMFGIDMDGKVCYIDSNYCMINLPEYVGTLCSYDITNSYASVFTAHGFEIPSLTGEVIPGFENVQLKDGSFLVPLLYPTARKLEAAIEYARAKGYRLKIYEAYRPHEASVYMYQKASEIQYAELPETEYEGEEPEEFLYVGVVNEDGEVALDENGEPIERRKTYWELMNDENDSFTLSAFVSGGISRHNLGVALDLTLESIHAGEEFVMQTALHDLSRYSAQSRNNEYAKELSAIMLSAGFGGLYSEWWHFQDDETRKELSPPYAEKGVSSL